MSTVPDTDQGCPGTSEPPTTTTEVCQQICEKKRKKSRNVCFPEDGELVTQYFEPANPWQQVPTTTRAQLVAEYLESCRRHNTPPIEVVLQQIRELPENTIGGGNRAPRLSLAECSLLGAAPVDALEALLRKVQFRRLEVDHAAIDDEGAEALFDMIEYYESGMVVCISGPRQFGIRGWQAASRMIKKSAELSELEVSESGLEASHAPVLARALRPHTCRLRSLCLQRALLSGEPLMCLVIALKSNNSVRELRLGDNGLSPMDAAQIASLLRINTNIHLLDLSNNQIQDAGAGHIAEALVEQAAHTPPSVTTSPLSPQHCPLIGGHETRGLAFLVLWNNQLTRNCAQHLSKALRASKSLCVLNIGRNALGGDTVRALNGSGALISLGLQAARLAGDAARAVADLIRQDRTLQRLDLRDNRLGSSGLQAILSAMKENTTLTQIDLDDPTESKSRATVEGSEAASVLRMSREIASLCRRNETEAGSPERRLHRKISLTCNTACLPTTPLAWGEEVRRPPRLRSPLPSPAPSPAGSPVPTHHSPHSSHSSHSPHHHHHHGHSRFSVTRVTPERDSSTDSSSPSTPTRPTFCPTPSRFKVVQVSEPPQIQVHPASEPRKLLSRFSVTRNYDKMYNPSPSPSPVPSSGSDTPADDMADEDSDGSDVLNPDSVRQASKSHSVIDSVGMSSESDERVRQEARHKDSEGIDDNLWRRDENQTISDKFCVKAVSVDVRKSADSANAENNRFKGDARYTKNLVTDNVESTVGSISENKIKPGNKRFSVSNVSDAGKSSKRFTTHLVVESTQQASPSSPSDNIETNRSNVIFSVTPANKETQYSMQTSNVNKITPVDSEISKILSSNVIPVNAPLESTSFVENVDPNIGFKVKPTSKDNLQSQVIDNSTAVTSKVRLKSCMKSSDGNLQEIPQISEGITILGTDNNETGEDLSSHPNLKNISDLFKTLELYGNTADNTVSLTSLTESRRPSVRDIFNVDKTDSKGVDKSPRIDNASTDLRLTAAVDNATETSVPSSSEINRLSTIDVDSNRNINVDTSINEESHCDKSIGMPIDNSICLSTEIDHKHHQPDDVVIVQRGELDISEKVYEATKNMSNKVKHIPEKSSNNENKKSNTIFDKSFKSVNKDFFEKPFEKTKLHSIDEVDIRTTEFENFAPSNVVKNESELAHVDMKLQELIPGSTPHPSKGKTTFVIPEYEMDVRINKKYDDETHKNITDFTKCEMFANVSMDKIIIDDFHKEECMIADETPVLRHIDRIDPKISSKIAENIFIPICTPEPILIPVHTEMRNLSIFDTDLKNLDIREMLESDRKNSPEQVDSIKTIAIFNNSQEMSVVSEKPAIVPDLPVLEISDNINVNYMCSIKNDELISCNVHIVTEGVPKLAKEIPHEPIITQKDNTPTNLPEIKIISRNKTDFIDKIDIESLCDMGISNKYNMTSLLPQLNETFTNVSEVPKIVDDNLPGSVPISSEIPIYSISHSLNIPSTSKAIFNPVDVTTQTDFPGFDSELSTIHTDLDTDIIDLRGIMPNVSRQIERLTQTETESSIAEITRQIEIVPRQTELSIKESRIRSENLSGVVSCSPGDVPALGKSDFSSILHSDSIAGQEVQVFLDEFKGTPKIENVKSMNTGGNTKYSDSETRTKINLRDKTVGDSDKDTLKYEKDINVHNVSGVRNTVIKNVTEKDAIDEIDVNKSVKTIGTTFLLVDDNYKNIEQVHSSAICDNNKKSDTVTNRTLNKDTVSDKKGTAGSSGDKQFSDSDKCDAYKDVYEVLTHSETKNAGIIKSETQLVKNTIEITDEEKIDVEMKMTVIKENLEGKSTVNQSIVKKEDALKQIELITKDLGDLIDEMKIVKEDRDKKDNTRNKKEQMHRGKNDLEKPKDLVKNEREISLKIASKSNVIVKTDVRDETDFETDKENLLLNKSCKLELATTVSDKTRDHNETERYIKYLGHNETERELTLDNKGKSSVKDIIVESDIVTHHVIKSDIYRKEPVFEIGSVDNQEKHIDEAVKYKKEIKDKTPAFVNESVLKKNKSESSLDSSDLEVSRLMHKYINPYCDSSSSLEISGSSVESLTEPKLIITKEIVDSDVELDRRKEHMHSTGSSVESTDVAPMNPNLLNMSMSSNESVSPVFGKTKNIRDSLSSLEASVSSLESNRQERVMVTSADSGIEHSLPKDVHDSSSNEGTLTNLITIKHDTLTESPKRASSLLDVPALKTKGLDRMRKISWVAPSSSFHAVKQDDKEVKPSHLEKLLSLFQHPSSIFSRSTDEEKKCNTPPKKDSLLTSSFWSWGSGERDKDDSSEATDSTLSERVQVSFVDESFSKKLDSKTPSTDTENTLSEFQTFTQPDARECESVDTCIVTQNTTDKSLVQIDLSLKCTEANNGNRKVSDSLDVVSPNDFNKNYETTDSYKNSENSPDISEHEIRKDEKPEMIRPRSFAAVLKASVSENSLEKQSSPEGQPVDKLPSKVIKGIKENISPENTLTSSMTNTKALALELSERQSKSQTVVNTVWEMTNPLLEKERNEEKLDQLAPIATIEETCDETADIIHLDYIDDDKVSQEKVIDVAKDALSYLVYETREFGPSQHKDAEKSEQNLAEELKQAEIKDMIDLSPELIIDEAIEVPEVFTVKEVKGMRTSPIIPERAKLKKSNSLEDLGKEIEKTTKTKTIAFKVPESKPKDIPERSRLRTSSGSSPKSLPESLNRPCPLTKIDTALARKTKRVCSLGKMAKDSLLALNMSEEEIAEFRRSYKLTSVESLRSLESVSEDANSQSGNSIDSRCRACLRTSQESLMSLDSINEDVCRCSEDRDKPSKTHR